MCSEAKKYAEQDAAVKERVEARSSLDHYLAALKRQAEDTDKLASKLEEDDLQVIKDAVKDGEEWLAENPDAEADETNEKKHEIEKLVQPIVAKLYPAAKGSGANMDDDDDDDNLHDEL